MCMHICIYMVIYIYIYKYIYIYIFFCFLPLTADARRSRPQTARANEALYTPKNITPTKISHRAGKNPLKRQHHGENTLLILPYKSRTFGAIRTGRARERGRSLREGRLRKVELILILGGLGIIESRAKPLDVGRGAERGEEGRGSRGGQGGRRRGAGGGARGRRGGREREGRGRGGKGGGQEEGGRRRGGAGAEGRTGGGGERAEEGPRRERARHAKST